MARTIAVSNQKGGVGKTTTVANLGAALSEMGQRVLIVDLDSRGDLGVHFGVGGAELDTTVYEGIFAEEVGFEEVIIHVEEAGIDLAPATRELAGAELILGDMAPADRGEVVAEALAPVQSRYDFIIIDTAPGLHLLLVATLAAASEVIIPQQASYLALHGLREITGNIEQLRQMGPRVSICGILLTMQDRRTIHHRQVIHMVREGFGELVFDTVVPATIRFQEAPASGQPITQYAPNSEAAQVYRQIAREVVERAPQT